MSTDVCMWENAMRREAPKKEHGKYCYPQGGFWIYGARCEYLKKGKEAACQMGFFHGADCRKGHQLTCKSIVESVLQSPGESINCVFRPKECKDYTIPLSLQYEMGFSFGIYVNSRGKKLSDRDKWRKDIKDRCRKCGFKGSLWSLIYGHCTED